MSPKLTSFLFGAALVSALTLTACNQTASDSPANAPQNSPGKTEQKIKSVAITAIVEHPSLDAIRDGVQKTLTDNGYEIGKNLHWQYQSAQGNTATALQIARKFVGDKPDVIVAIATPSAQAVVASTQSIPVIFSGVTDPVGAQLVAGWGASRTNVTGFSDILDLNKQVDLIQQVIPTVKTVGMVYNPGEANSVFVVDAIEKILQQRNISLITSAAPRSIDVSSAAHSIANKVDVFYTNTDNNVVSAYEALVKVGITTQTPLIAADAASVPRGAVAALGVDYYDMGLQTGQLVLRIFAGEQPGDIVIQTSDKLPLHLNLSAAKAQGVELSQALIDSANEVLD